MGILNYGSQFIDKDDILSVKSSLVRDYLTQGLQLKHLRIKKKKFRLQICSLLLKWNCCNKSSI